MIQRPLVVVAYHSGFGHTEVLAEAVHRGATGAGAEAALYSVEHLGTELWAELAAANAIIFGSPTYMGTASGAFHAFAEASSRVWLQQGWKDKLASGFTNAACKAGDKSSTLDYFATLAAQHGMNWVNLGLHPGWHTTVESENDLNRLGYFNGAAATTPADVGPEGVHKADIATAEHLGARVAQHAAVVLAGRAALGVN